MRSGGFRLHELKLAGEEAAEGLEDGAECGPFGTRAQGRLGEGPPAADAVDDEASKRLVLAPSQQFGGKGQHDARVVVGQVVGAVVDESVAGVEFAALAAGVAAIELLVAFPAALGERNRFGAHAVEGGGAGALDFECVGKCSRRLSAAQARDHEGGVGPAAAPGLVAKAAEEKSEVFIEKGPVGRFVDRLRVPSLSPRKRYTP